MTMYRRVTASLLALAAVGVFLAPLPVRAERPVVEEVMIGLSKTIQQVAREAIPKTVGIKIHVGNRSGYGSGAIISADGLILTCAHVIEPGQRHTVMMPNGDEYPVRVLGSNSKNDYTLIKIEPKQPLPFFALGSSGALKVRDWVIALGHPGGPYADLQPAVAVGRVRGLGKQLPVGGMKKFYDDAILTDCPIFGGNSGGPLINLEGELVGLNGAILLVNKNAYAAPIDRIKAVLPQLKRGEQVEGTGPKNMMEMFAQMQKMQGEMNPEDMQKLYGKSPLMKMLQGFMGGNTKKAPAKVKVKLGARLSPIDGDLVFADIDPEGTVGRAGIQAGDALISVDTIRVRDGHSLREALLPLREGQATVIVVRRGDEQVRRVAVFAVSSPDRQPILRFALNRLGRRAALATVAVEAPGAEGGYGTVVGPNHVLTCDHILGNARMVRLTQVDGSHVVGRVIGRDGEYDLALIEANLDGRLTRPVAIDATRRTPGEWVLSGGAARGPLMVGAVSATRRRIIKERKVGAMGLFGMFGKPNKSPLRPYPALFQHDTPLDKGLFGSGVFDTDGELVGVNVGLWYRGSAYAVPGRVLAQRLERLRGGLMAAQPPVWAAPEGGGMMGLGELFKRFMGGGDEQKPAPPASPVLGRGFIGIKIDPEKGLQRQAIWVSEVVPGGPADKAGIKKDDLIANVGGQGTHTPEALIRRVSAMAPGTRTTVIVVRNYKKIVLKITIGERPR